MFITLRIPSISCGGRSGNIISVNGVCTWLLQLLVAMQMLMTLEISLSSTMALPVTSKPIESTAENLAWQAWLMLPPEQKQLMKSRKVTPKSIFTLPLRMDCPEGHQKVDSKCIPTVIGSNSVLIDPNVLGLVLGNSPTDIEYDYEDEVAEDKEPDANNLPLIPPLYLSDPMGEEKAKDELQPPSQDAPLKFSIFQSKFPTDDYAMEDYSSMSNEGSGGQTQEIESNLNATAAVNDTITISLNITTNITTHRDLVSEASNVSKVHSFTTLPDSTDFNLDDIDAISLPAFATHQENSHKISIFKEDSSLHLVTSDMETDVAGATEKDLETLLQTESLMPMINQSTTTPENLPTTRTEVNSDVSNDEAPSSAIDLSVEGEELATTLPSTIQTETINTMKSQDKAEHIRSVTINSFISANDEEDGIEVTTLTPSSSYDEPSASESEKDETTTSPTIQLDETTIIEGNDEFSSLLSTSDAAKELLPSSSTSSSSASESVESLASSMIPPTLQPVAEELATLLLQQEQAVKDFEELQRMRKGQKDQHTVMKKSKVEPVEVLSTMPTATNLSETMLSEMTTTTTTMHTLNTTTATATETKTATVTPLLGVNNNNKPNDRFYYQHIAKQDLERVAVTPSQQPSSTTPAPTAWSTNIETLPSTMTANRDKASEIDLAKELRLINDLVKGKRPIKTKTSTSATSTSTIATAEPSSTVGGSKSTTSKSVSSTSESSVNSIKPSRATAEIWSKIMPFLTTTTPDKTTTTSESLTESSTMTDEGTTLSSFHLTASTPPAVVSNRSHRNSKIIRIDGFNTIQATPTTIATTPAKIKTTTTTEDIFSTTAVDETSSAAPTPSQDETSSPAEDSHESFWWLPVSWRYDKPSTTTTTTVKPEQVEGSSEHIPLLLRFWSAYHAPKSS